MSGPSNALCFGHEFPATGMPCRVQIDRHELTVFFEAGDDMRGEEVVSYSEIAVSAGGLDHDQLVIKWTGPRGERTLYLKDPSLIRAFRTAAPGHLSLPLEQAAERVRQVRHRRRMAWTIAGGAVIVLIFGLWFGSDVLVDLAVDRIPVEWERKLGEAAYRDFLAQQRILNEGPAVKAIKEITHRLSDQIPNNPYTFEVTVVNSDVVNAFALPGGYIVVFTGLIKKAESGEEVAGVLSHEINHVLQRHGLERIVKSAGLLAVVAIIVGDQQGLIGLAKQVGVELLSLKFGRAQEAEADLTGLHLLYRAKIDPAGMIVFFERLSEKDEGRVEWLSTHPMSAGRAERLKQELASLPRFSPEPFPFEWKTIQESIGAPSSALP